VLEGLAAATAAVRLQAVRLEDSLRSRLSRTHQSLPLAHLVPQAVAQEELIPQVPLGLQSLA
jgi:hypothetical protein